MSSATKEYWEKVDGFKGWSEYDRFIVWIEKQVNAGHAVEIDVLGDYSGTNFRQRWFQNVNSKNTWRLVEPDPPFAGTFQIVSES